MLIKTKIKQVTIYLYILFALTTFSSMLVRAENDNEQYDGKITIVEGQTKILPYPGVTQVSIGHPDIANAVSTAPNEVLLTGLKAGTTDVRVWAGGHSEKRYLLNVVDQSWVKVFDSVKLILGDVEGVKIREDKGIVFVEGRVFRDQDVEILKTVKERFQSEIQKGVLVVNVVLPMVSMKSMVLLSVEVLEVRRSELVQLGVDWDDSTGGPMFQATGTFNAAGNFTKNFANGTAQQATGVYLPVDKDTLLPMMRLQSRINVLAQNGVAKILAEPKLITRSGSRAEFLGGGEVPIKIVSTNGQSNVIFKQYGVILNMEPVADPDGYIAMRVEVEVSSIDTSVSADGLPGFLSRKTKSEMNLQSGQTMVISGLINASDSKNISKIPGLGSLPVIGELFKSHDFQKNSSELVIFVTPKLVDPEGAENKRAMSRKTELIKQEKQDVKYSIFD